MSGDSQGASTLAKSVAGDAQATIELSELVYSELRRRAGALMRRERANHTVQPTELVHEAYMKIVGGEVEVRSRSHFFALASGMMRRFLIDHAKRRGIRPDRKGLDDALGAEESPRLTTDELPMLVALDSALRKMSQAVDRPARLVEMHVFGGLSLGESAELLGISRRTAATDWQYAKAWLRSQLRESPDGL